MGFLTLGIETSCDDTCAAVIDSDCRVLSNVVSSQFDLHRQYGGVVPELASRSHSRNIVHVLDAALKKGGVLPEDLDLVAVTRGPGLVGSLLVGLMVAKGLAWDLEVPLVGVNHLTAHIWAGVLDEARELPVPSVCLIVSGGHTELVLIEGRGEGEGRLLGQTRDDAAGEAFDKVARILSLGYPGGPIIDRLAGEYSGDLVDFPRPMLDGKSLDFSFSGLKTAVAVYVEERRRERGLSEEEPLDSSDAVRIAASFQSAAVDVLAQKAMQAVGVAGVRNLVVAGGVAANSELRRCLGDLCEDRDVDLIIPPPRYCTDNAAMIAAAGRRKFQASGPDGLGIDVNPSLALPLRREQG